MQQTRLINFAGSQTWSSAPDLISPLVSGSLVLSYHYLGTESSPYSDGASRESIESLMPASTC